MMNRRYAATAFAFFLAFLVSSARGQNHWPQHLGPNRNGISQEKGLMTEWPAGGPKVVWRAKGGVGMSGLAIQGDRLATVVQKDEKQIVVCLNAKTGRPMWETAVAPAFGNGQGNGPRATPTISGGNVFVFTGEGVLASLRLEDGKLNWSRNAVQGANGRVADYGMACSPLVVGDRVIVTVGGRSATVVALDAASGKLAWTSGQGDPAGYSSPALLKAGGVEQVVVFTGGSVLGVAPDTGASLWRYPYRTDYECNIATPLGIDGDVFVSAGENHGCVRLKLTPEGDGFSIQDAWTSLGPKSVLRNEWQTSILLDGYLYGFDNVGSAGPVTHLACVNAKTGQQVWRENRFGKGNLIAADNKLFISTMKGELVVVKASPEGFQELGRAKVLGSTRQAPALANGMLYLRDGREIVCVDVRK